MSNYRLVLSSIPFAAILLFLCCTPIVYSPHAQNEMITPYNRMGEIHEIGGAFAFNKWMIHQGIDTVYFRTYPSASLSLYHNIYSGWGKFGGIGGIELISLPVQWWFPDASGFLLWFKPYLGFQYNGSVFTCRFNLSPIAVSVGYSRGEWGTGAGLSTLTFYQLTMLLRNQLPSNHRYWGGIRNSPGAFALVSGYEHSFSANNFFRAEYSYLMKPPFSPLLSYDELESIKGSVHYLTFGFFRRMK